MKLLLVAEIDDADSKDEAVRRLDAFREAVQPGAEYGVHLYQFECAGDLARWCDRARAELETWEQTDQIDGSNAIELADLVGDALGMFAEVEEEE